MRWEILSGQLTHKGREILYHVQCDTCKTIRILSKSELETEKCYCSRRANHCKKEKSKA